MNFSPNARVECGVSPQANILFFAFRAARTPTGFRDRLISQAISTFRTRNLVENVILRLTFMSPYKHWRYRTPGSQDQGNYVRTPAPIENYMGRILSILLGFVPIILFRLHLVWLDATKKSQNGSWGCFPVGAILQRGGFYCQHHDGGGHLFIHQLGGRQQPDDSSWLPRLVEEF
jgi:hypothetical protein